MTKTQLIKDIMSSPANQATRTELRAMSTDKLEELYEDLFGDDAQLAAQMDADLESMESGTQAKPLTDEEIAAANAEAEAEFAAANEVVAADNVEEEAMFVAAVRSAYDQLDGAKAEGVSKCAALRAVASTGHHTRKAFIIAAQQHGINKHTAATQWQRGRSGK